MAETITVVCPTYNAAAYVERAIACLVGQTVPPAEVIFSDDGSQDDTVALLELGMAKLRDVGIAARLLRGAHRGPGGARNAGIVEAASTWIAFLDADDIWEREKIRMVSEAIRENPGTNFVTHWEQYLRLDGEKPVLRHGAALSEGQPLPRQLYFNNVFSTSAVVCRKALIDSVGGFDESLPVSQDYELWLRMSPAIKLTALQEVLGYYVENPLGITARPYGIRYWSLVRVLLRHRRKGGLGLVSYRLARATMSPQWYRSILARGANR